MKTIFKWLILLIELVVLSGLILNFLRTMKLIELPPDSAVAGQTNGASNEPIEYIPELPTPTLLPTKIIEPTKTPTKSTPIPTKKPVINSNDDPWGISKQIDDVTWTMKIGEDKTMATPGEILEALNQYRKVHNSQILTWDEKIGAFAQQRAQYLNGLKSVDKHTGFKNFLEKEDGFNKLRFSSLGENISFGYRLNGVHTIEWMYAGDKPHDDNQLNNKWDHVGIGVDGLATCLIFATGKF